MPWNDTMWLSLRINQYGIVDARENLVLISYMIIYNIGELITATEEFFIEAFFRQGKDT